MLPPIGKAISLTPQRVKIIGAVGFGVLEIWRERPEQIREKSSPDKS
jgi:hypothetical protein